MTRSSRCGCGCNDIEFHGTLEPIRPRRRPPYATDPGSPWMTSTKLEATLDVTLTAKQEQWLLDLMSRTGAKPIIHQGAYNISYSHEPENP